MNDIGAVLTGARDVAEMDVVYIVREGADNEELRYSLRSLVNFPHRRVWISGYRPPWVVNCELVPGNPGNIGRTRAAKIYNNVVTAAAHSGISDNFVLFDDDFFVTAPVTTLPAMRYAKSLREHAAELFNADAPWDGSMFATAGLLETLGVDNPVSYELHVPMVFNKQILLDVMERYVSYSPPRFRSLYGNLAQVVGVPTGDVRTTGGSDLPAGPFLSTRPGDFALVQPALAEMFPEPSPYEGSAQPQQSELVKLALLAQLIKARSGGA